MRSIGLAETKMNHLFAYGTLMCADIMEDVSRSNLASIPATLTGFSRRAVQSEHYPGVIPDPNGRVEGVVYRNVPTTAWERLDRFEGSMYARQTVRIELVDGGELLADVYVVRPEFLHRLGRSDWDFADFIRRRKSHFRRSYQGFRSV